MIMIINRLLSLYSRNAVPFFSLVPLHGDNFEQGRDEGFFEVSKAEPIGNLGDGRGEGRGKGDGAVGSEFGPE